jgi:hypothetical protein
MAYDTNNEVIKLCAEGMAMEGQGNNEEALRLFQQAWDRASDDFERSTAAHYVARHQKTTLDKLHWDTLALDLAKQVKDESIKATYPSLYLNIGKCFEDLNDKVNAHAQYLLASSFTQYLNDDGYGKMIKNAVRMGIERTGPEKDQ